MIITFCIGRRLGNTYHVRINHDIRPRYNTIYYKKTNIQALRGYSFRQVMPNLAPEG
jgi:hypothetical protein